MLTERLVPESSANLVAALADLHCNELAPHYTPMEAAGSRFAFSSSQGSVAQHHSALPYSGGGCDITTPITHIVYWGRGDDVMC